MLWLLLLTRDFFLALTFAHVCCIILQCVAVFCSVLLFMTRCSCLVLAFANVCCSKLQYVAVCCRVLQCVAVCCPFVMLKLRLWHQWLPCLDIAECHFCLEAKSFNSQLLPLNCKRQCDKYQVRSAHDSTVLWSMRPDTSLAVKLETLCRSVLQCVAVSCSRLRCVAVCRSVLQYAAVCWSVVQCVAVRWDTSHAVMLETTALQCSRLQCVAVCCSALRYENLHHARNRRIRSTFLCTSWLHHTTPLCIKLQHTVTHCTTLQRILQHAAPH